jgi:hypothetical protein
VHNLDNWDLDDLEKITSMDEIAIVSCIKTEGDGERKRVYFLCFNREDYQGANLRVTFDQTYDFSSTIIRGRIPESWI